jgi:hypothetical protein
MKYYFLNIITFELNKMVLHNNKQKTLVCMYYVLLWNPFDINAVSYVDS